MVKDETRKDKGQRSYGDWDSKSSRIFSFLAANYSQLTNQNQPSNNITSNTNENHSNNQRQIYPTIRNRDEQTNTTQQTNASQAYANLAYQQRRKDKGEYEEDYAKKLKETYESLINKNAQLQDETMPLSRLARLYLYNSDTSRWSYNQDSSRANLSGPNSCRGFGNYTDSKSSYATSHVAYGSNSTYGSGSTSGSGSYSGKRG